MSLHIELHQAQVHQSTVIETALRNCAMSFCRRTNRNPDVLKNQYAYTESTPFQKIAQELSDELERMGYKVNR